MVWSLITLSNTDKLTNVETINKIITINEELRDFWTSVDGWAPVEAAQLLSKSRLDWQVSLSKCLKIWTEDTNLDDRDGRLILAWTNLGSLVEGTMKLFLSVWYESYKKDTKAFKRKDRILTPNNLNLEKLRIFFKEEIWSEKDKRYLDNWILNVQQKRNAIHSYEDRNIGDFNEFFTNIQEYFNFLIFINNKLPYPDEEYRPRVFARISSKIREK